MRLLDQTAQRLEWSFQDLNHQLSAFALLGVFQSSPESTTTSRAHSLFQGFSKVQQSPQSSVERICSSWFSRQPYGHDTAKFSQSARFTQQWSSRFEPPVERIRSSWFSQQPYGHDTSMIINIATFLQSVRFFEWHFIQRSVCFHFQLLPVGVRLILITSIISLQDF
jgi:hypothetical protein